MTFARRRLWRFALLACVAWRGGALQHRVRSGPRSLVLLHGKKAKKVNREEAWQRKKEAEAAAKLRRGGRATDLPAAVVSVGDEVLEEDHRHEQFFYDDATSARMLGLVSSYERPLLVCNPSLAAKLDAAGSGREYLLLDRDERFARLGSRYRRFDLRAPERPIDYDFDAIFIDPPFANVVVDELAEATRVLLGPKSRRTPLYVGYNVQRAAELEAAFADFGLANTGEVLGYATGVMKNRIALFANT